MGDALDILYVRTRALICDLMDYFCSIFRKVIVKNLDIAKLCVAMGIFLMLILHAGKLKKISIHGPQIETRRVLPNINSCKIDIFQRVSTSAVFS